MLTAKNSLRFMPLLLLACFTADKAFATTTTINGRFLDDTSSFVYSFTSASAQNYVFSTSSFASGGFVPVLTLFNAGGMDLGSDGGDGPCVTAATCRDDAYLSQNLASGSYLLYLTEFPNTPSPTGRLSDGFLFGLDPSSLDPTITGDICGVPGGTFIQTDTTACTQRTNAYTVSITNSPTVTPEPATIFLVLPPALLLLGFTRRSIA